MPLCIEVIFRSIPIADHGLQARRDRSSIHLGIGNGPSGDAAETVAAKNKLETASKRWFFMRFLQPAGLGVPSALKGATRARP